MSNIYIQEPPALGKVLLKTTVGDVDIELWTKEAPKACRNFIQLCMENYYNETIFHRVIPGFIVQGGDPNGDGSGGESIYGAPFKDEFHSRLRFNRRGLVAMANAGKDDNGSQFFITLGPTPELQNKHTIFGKVTGETIYNVLKLTEGLIGPDDTPVHPHKIIGATVVINPFTDIVPRASEIRVEEEVQKTKKKKEKKGVKNFGLLSFGEEAEEDEDEAEEYRGKPKSTHDLLDDPKLSSKTAAELEEAIEDEEKFNEDEAEKRRKETEATVDSIKEKLKKKKRDKSAERKNGTREKNDDVSSEGSSRKRRKKTDDSEGELYRNKRKDEEESEDSGEYYLGKERDIERRKQRDKIRDEIKLLKKEMKTSAEDKTKEKEQSKQNEKVKENKLENNDMYKEFVETQEKYKKLKEKIPLKGTARGDFTMNLLSKFTNKLHQVKENVQTEDKKETEDSSKVEEEDSDTDYWLSHKLRAEDTGAVLAKDASTKGDDWFDIYDPRNRINKRRRENRENKNKK